MPYSGNIFGGGGYNNIAGSNFGGGGFQPNANIGYQYGGPQNVNLYNQYNPAYGGASTYGYNPATSISSPRAAFTAPVYTNTMGGGRGWGGTPSSPGAGRYTNTMAPESWNRIAANTRSQYGQNVMGTTPSSSGDFVLPGGGGRGVQASDFDRYSLMSGNYGGSSPLGTAAGNAASYPNPGVSLPAINKTDIMAGLFGGEDPSPGATNPYQMKRVAMQELARQGQYFPTTSQGEPPNAQVSQDAASAFVGGLMNRNRYPEQVAIAYGPSGQANVNPNYNPNVRGSTPYINNVSLNPTRNQTPSAYLYGNPSTGYPGVMAGMNYSAANRSFAQSPGVGQPTAAGYPGGRY